MLELFGANCHTRAQLTISTHLIYISDDQLGSRSGIKIIWKMSGRPADRCYSFGIKISFKLAEVFK